MGRQGFRLILWAFLHELATSSTLNRLNSQTQHSLQPSSTTQLGLTLSSTAVQDFQVSRPPPIASVTVDPQADKDAKAVARRGATSVIMSVNLTNGVLSLHSGGYSHKSQVHQGEVPVAWAHYNNSQFETGWAFLSVHSTEDSRVSRDVTMYAAGYIEGLLSAQQIRDFQHNANVLMAHDEAKHHALENIRDLFSKNLNTICNYSGMKIGTVLVDKTAPADPWWRQARYALLQAWGTLDAYNTQLDRVGGQPMSMVDLMVLNSDGETPELEMAYDFQETLLRQSPADDADNSTDGEAFLQRSTQRRNGHPHGSVFLSPRAVQAQRANQMRRLDEKAWRNIKESAGRCSALVRVTEGNRDIMVGHTTFSDYSEMNRIFKYYDLPVGSDAVRKMGFSSYPGVAGSTDDYYLLDSGLVITETTISMLTDEPYDKIKDSNTSVPDFMRIMISNRLAKTGKDWTDLMTKSATGTYSSQWMVVDYNKFVPGKPLVNGTLSVIEQVPGLSHTADMSMWLQTKRYWGSENRPWYKDIRDSVGATEAEEMHGELFSADKNPRAKVFAATAPQVRSLAEMRTEMQRNRWPHEVGVGLYSAPYHAISARGDLDKESPNPNGGVDSKVTNRCLAKLLQCNAISGPTHDTQKVFKWTDKNGKELFPGSPHDGLPDSWGFGWVRMTPDGASSLQDLSCDA